MLGLEPDCYHQQQDVDDCLSYCDFFKKISRVHGAIGVFNSGSVNSNAIIEILTRHAYEKYLEVCNSEFSTAPLIHSVLDDCFTVVTSDCVTLCGEAYKTFTSTYCDICGTTTFSDEFISKVPYLMRMSHRLPNRDLYDEVASLFGWEFIYSESGIYVRANPDEFFAIKHLLPIPIGEQMIPIELGC